MAQVVRGVMDAIRTMKPPEPCSHQRLILHHALLSAKNPPRLEPSGLLHSLQWQMARWYVHGAKEAGQAIGLGRDIPRHLCSILLWYDIRQCLQLRRGRGPKYMGLDHGHSFTPVAIETLGVV